MLQNVRPEVLERLAHQNTLPAMKQAADSEIAQRLLTQATKDEPSFEAEAEE